MSDLRKPRVAVDATGGDNAPEAILEGVRLALSSDLDLVIYLLGPADVVGGFVDEHPRCHAVVTSQVIGMDENPTTAVRTKWDSSIVRGCRMVKEGEADAFFSAGSTGSCMAAATLVIGRVMGVSRPAIATVIPTERRPLVLLDVGANADCKPEFLVDFANMGIAYAHAALGVESPKVALLNIGEEPTKGSQLTIEAHRLLESSIPGFVGNLEGRYLTKGLVDVVVTDGFTGNVTLKLLEGLSRSLLLQVKEAMLSDIVSRAGALMVKHALLRLKERLDPDTYGGAPLLGVKGVCIIGHGSSGPTAVSNALLTAARCVRAGLVGKMERVSGAGNDSKGSA